MRITGYIDVPLADRSAVAKALPEHIHLTRAEPGCRSFEVTPDSERAGRYRVVEVFDDEAAFKAYQTRTRSSRWAENSANVVRHYETD